MSLTSGPINEAEAAAEKAGDHFTDHLQSHLEEALQAFFDRLWRTRITITVEIAERK